jgi:Tfp pilus assembly protein FimT
MVTIGLGAILMGIAVPSLMAWLPTQRLADGARQVALELQNARMNAISQSLRVGLNFAAAGANAYVIFQDADADGVYDNPGDPVVRGPVALPQGITAAAASTVVFQPRGTTTVAIPININLGNGTATTNIQITIVGRVNIT